MISVVTATYNRSNVLFYAISSLIRSTFEDWELIIVGDACTDDTREVVAGFADSRIRFYNLAENFGDQSGPNNAGVDLARGEYIAFLNHDDLYFPDHLETSLAFLRKTGADFVHASALRCHPVGEPDTDFSMRLTLHAVSDSEKYNPLSSVPPSTWLVRRELFESIGPWKPATELHCSSSQDWLFRAWRQGARMFFKPLPTVLIIPSGIRKKDYATRENRDIKSFFEQIGDSHFREIHLARIASRAAAQRVSVRLSPQYHLRTFGAFSYRLLARLLMRFGIGPRTVLRFLTFGRRGNFIQHLRKKRGLPRLDPKHQKSAVLKFDSHYDNTSPTTEIT